MNSHVIKALIPLALFLVLGGFFALGLTKDPKILPSEMIDRPLPAFELEDLFDATQSITENDLRGDVRLVNIFGSWCTSCVIEHPVLMKIAKSGTVEIIGVDWRDTRENALAWLERYDNPYTRIIYDKDSVLAIQMGVTGAPESFVIDKQGNIRYKVTGIISDEMWRKTLSPMIKQLRAE